MVSCADVPGDGQLTRSTVDDNVEDETLDELDVLDALEEREMGEDCSDTSVSGGRDSAPGAVTHGPSRAGTILSSGFLSI